VQADFINPKLKPPATKRLKLKCDVLLSDLAFKFNLRHFSEALKINYANDRDAAAAPGGGGPGGGGGRGLHSFTSQLNLIHFSHTSPCPPV